MKKLGDIRLGKEDRQAVEAAIAILRDRFPVRRVVLFGSKARGDSDADSDIDLLVLTERKLTWQERDAVTSALFELQLRMDVVLSTLVLSMEEWNGGFYQVLPIRGEIERDGAIL
jgi:predicted nucleotidyltransferase